MNFIFERLRLISNFFTLQPMRSVLHVVLYTNAIGQLDIDKLSVQVDVKKKQPNDLPFVSQLVR